MPTDTDRNPLVRDTDLIIMTVIIIPGHGGELQSSVSSDCPLQFEPPYNGDGLVQ